jgi:hypothetical protein
MTIVVDNKTKAQKEIDEEIKAIHRKKLYELSIKSLGEIPQLEEPNYEQQEWIKRKTWRTDK